MLILGHAPRTGREQTALWQECERLLSHARLLNPSDPELVYLMGLSLLAQGKSKVAARSFLEAYRENGPLRSRALRYLRRIYEASKETGRGSFEGFLKDVENTKPDSLPRPLPQGSAPQTQSQGWDYAGTETCRECHAGQHTAWSRLNYAQIHFASVAAFVAGWRSS